MKIQDLIGIPYKSGGRELDGADCWGIVVLASRLLYDNLIPQYNGHYDDSEDQNQTRATMLYRFDWMEVPLAAIMPGDVLVLKVLGQPTHAGIYIGDRKMLHSLARRDSCIERIDSDTWKNRIEGVYRWPKH